MVCAAIVPAADDDDVVGVSRTESVLPITGALGVRCPPSPVTALDAAESTDDMSESTEETADETTESAAFVVEVVEAVAIDEDELVVSSSTEPVEG